MLNKLILFILTIGDYFHKKKIINFFKKNSINKFDCIFDIGAHQGESIKFFLNNFTVKKIYSFEPIPDIFKILQIEIPKLNKKYDVNIQIENFAIGSIEKDIEIKKMVETSSSTIREINLESRYFKRKKKLLYSGKTNFYKSIKVKQIKLKNYINSNAINKINLLKIDTEGYEFDVLKGLEEKLNKVENVIFEHHYHDMIKKNYNFSDINNLLIENNFKQIYKSKMPFRKTFEYIYAKQQ